MSYLIAKTLTACVDGVGPSMGGLIAPYKIVKFHMGHSPSLVDEPNKTVTSMPLNTETVENIFHTGSLEVSDFQWSNGKLLVRCICPPAELTEPHVFSTLFLEDSRGKLSHGMVRLPETVLPETGAETWIYIEFPINTSAP